LPADATVGATTLDVGVGVDGTGVVATGLGVVAEGTGELADRHAAASPAGPHPATVASTATTAMTSGIDPGLICTHRW
jgi:hypothetical protein